MPNAAVFRYRSSASTMACRCSRSPARMLRRRRSISPKTCSPTTPLSCRLPSRQTTRRKRTKSRSSMSRTRARTKTSSASRSRQPSPSRARTSPFPPSSVQRPVTVALTGGIAAGKSEALAAFARHGAATASSDEFVHTLLAEDDDVRAAITERWGEDAVGDRRRIGEIVFQDPAELAWLEQLLHPRTRALGDVCLPAALGQLPVAKIAR